MHDSHFTRAASPLVIPSPLFLITYLWEVPEDAQEAILILQQHKVARGQLQEELGPGSNSGTGLGGQDAWLKRTCEFQAKGLQRKRSQVETKAGWIGGRKQLLGL